MPEKKDQKQRENELDIDVTEDTIVILGRIDCAKLTHCRMLISQILEKISSKKMKTHFVTCFETQFEFSNNIHPRSMWYQKNNRLFVRISEIYN